MAIPSETFNMSEKQRATVPIPWLVDPHHHLPTHEKCQNKLDQLWRP